MTEVYILVEDIFYEGAEIIGVYSTLELARAALPPNDDYVFSTTDKPSELLSASVFNAAGRICVNFHIEKHTIQP